MTDNQPTWDEMDQLGEDDWPDARCPECGMSGWDCTCANNFSYTDEDPNYQIATAIPVWTWRDRVLRLVERVLWWGR